MLFLEEMFGCTTMCFDGDGVPTKIIYLIRVIYNGIRIVVPIILIIIGMIDMAKAVTGKDEDEIKKAQNLLVKRGIAAVIVFLMLSLVTLLASLIKESDSMQCAYCILSGEESLDESPDDFYSTKEACVAYGGEWNDICGIKEETRETEDVCISRGGNWTGICDIYYDDGHDTIWEVPLPIYNVKSGCRNMAILENGIYYTYRAGCWSNEG